MVEFRKRKSITSCAEMIGIYSRSSLTIADKVYNSMLMDRADVFCGRLKWPLSTDNEGRELDDFDNDDAAYLISHDETGQHQASLRVHAMGKDSMTSQVFGERFDLSSVFETNSLEVTRFLVSPQSSEKLNAHASAVVFALCQYALSIDAEKIYGVCTKPMKRVYQRLGWAPDSFTSDINGQFFLAAWQVNSGVMGDIYEMSKRRGRSHLINVFSDCRNQAA